MEITTDSFDPKTSKDLIYDYSSEVRNPAVEMAIASVNKQLYYQRIYDNYPGILPSRATVK
jgi:hypothetical protein